MNNELMINAFLGVVLEANDEADMRLKTLAGNILDGYDWTLQSVAVITNQIIQYLILLATPDAITHQRGRGLL